MNKGETKKLKQYACYFAVFLIAFILLALILNTSLITALDSAINTFSVKLRLDLLVSFANILSILTDVKFMLVYSLVILLTLFIYKKRKESVFIASILSFTALAILALKELIGRTRPINQVVIESGFSFPSGHATFATVFFGILLITAYQKEFVHKKMIARASILAIVLISFARIYLNVHWATDIVGGILLGTSILFLGLITQTILSERKITI